MAGSLGKYRLDARLGGGGMAEVFAASVVGAEGFARRVAIKRVLPGYANNPTFAQMFVTEAQLSARLAHPNIVSVLDFDRDAQHGLFLVMELVDGPDLHALVDTGLLPYPVVIHIIAEVLRGLGHAHDLPLGGDIKGIVHRDVSPHNVLLSWDGDVKVSDFGLAKARDASQATATDFVRGKPAYMSPEQANGQALDGRSDLFSAGVMLWEMLTGRRLFSAEDTRATLAAVLFGTVPRPRQFRPDVPKDLEKVVMKLLEKEVAARYRSAGAAVTDLLACRAAGGGRELLSATLAERFGGNRPRAAVILPAQHEPTVADGPRVRPREGLVRHAPWLALLAVGVGVGGYVIASRVFGAKAKPAVVSEEHSTDVAIVGDAVLARSSVNSATASDAGADGSMVNDSGQLDASIDAPERDAGVVGASNDAGTRLVDIRKLPPSCRALVKELEKLSRCERQAPQVRDIFAQQLRQIRESSVVISQISDTRGPELACKMALESLLKVVNDC